MMIVIFARTSNNCIVTRELIAVVVRQHYLVVSLLWQHYLVYLLRRVN